MKGGGGFLVLGVEDFAYGVKHSAGLQGIRHSRGIFSIRDFDVAAVDFGKACF